MSDQRYNLRGVSASKEDVHNAIKNIDKGIFPIGWQWHLHRQLSAIPIYLLPIRKSLPNHIPDIGKI